MELHSIFLKASLLPCVIFSLTNSVQQIFDISGKVKKPAKLYKLLFKTSTDFYGRLTVYHLQFYGQFHS